MNTLDSARLASVLVACMVLAGCAPTSFRGEHEDRFKLRAAGQIEPTKTVAFLECIQHGFTNAPRYYKPLVHQARRHNGYRLDLMVDRHVLLSADILEDGRTQLLEGPSAGLISTGADIKIYEDCVATFGKPLSESPIPRG